MDYVESVNAITNLITALAAGYVAKQLSGVVAQLYEIRRETMRLFDRQRSED